MNVTVLNAIRDNRGNILRWQCTPLAGVHLERVHRGAEDGKTTLVMVWKNRLGPLSCVSKGELAEGSFSLDVGEYLMPGIVTEPPEAGAPIREYIRTHDVMQITAVEECLYGDPAMQHWEVECR